MKTPVSESKSLMLGKNEKGMSWCLQRLSKNCARKARTLTMFQSVPLYFSGLAVKREEKMNSSTRHAEAAKTYKFAAPAFLQYLQEQHDFKSPSWLTMHMMGQRTLDANDTRYYNEKTDATWTCYQEILRKIRSEWMPWVNDFMVKPQSSEGTLPSGVREEDMWGALQEFLYESGGLGIKRMKKSDYNMRRIVDNIELVMDNEETDVGGGTSGGAGGSDSPGGAMGNGTSSGAAGGEDGDSPGGVTGNGGPGGAADGESGDSPGDVMGYGGLGGAAGGGIPFAGNSDPDEIVRVRLPMPENWLHTYSLVFVCYGRFSDHPNPDMNLSGSDGPPDAEPAVDSASASSDSITRTPRPLTARTHVDQSMSRRHMKRQRAEDGREARREAYMTKVIAAVGSGGNDKREERVAQAADSISEGIRVANMQCARRDEISNLKEEISLLIECGLTEDLAAKRKELLDLLRSPTDATTLPPRKHGRNAKLGLFESSLDGLEDGEAGAVEATRRGSSGGGDGADVSCPSSPNVGGMGLGLVGAVGRTLGGSPCGGGGGDVDDMSDVYDGDRIIDVDV